MPEPLRKRLTLENVAGGAVPELFQHELERVLANIRDVNTPAAKPRTITVVLAIQPKEDRSGQRRELDVSVDVTSKLVPVRGATSYAFLENLDGELVATTNDVRQEELPLEVAAGGEVPLESSDTAPLRPRLAQP